MSESVYINIRKIRVDNLVDDNFVQPDDDDNVVNNDAHEGTGAGGEESAQGGTNLDAMEGASRFSFEIPCEIEPTLIESLSIIMTLARGSGQNKLRGRKRRLSPGVGNARGDGKEPEHFQGAPWGDNQ